MPIGLSQRPFQRILSMGSASRHTPGWVDSTFVSGQVGAVPAPLSLNGETPRLVGRRLTTARECADGRTSTIRQPP